MKIYTKVTWQWQPDGSLKELLDECESFEYEGPLALCGKGGGPQSPNYTQAAQAQGEASAQSNRMNNPNYVNPYGTRMVRYGMTASPNSTDLTGNPNDVTVIDSLSPVGQQRFEQEQRINQGLGNLGETGLGYVQGSLNQPFDQSRLPAQTVNAGQTGQDALLSRIEPQIKQDREMLKTQLYNQGLSEGGEAWDNAWRAQVHRENDLRMQAALHGINIGDQARQRGIQEQSFFRNEPLNMLNAVRSASPVGLPQFQNYAGGAAAAPMFNAAQAQGMFDVNRYGIEQGGYNNMVGGLFGIGQSLAGRNWG